MRLKRLIGLIAVFALIVPGLLATAQVIGGDPCVVLPGQPLPPDCPEPCESENPEDCEQEDPCDPEVDECETQDPEPDTEPEEDDSEPQPQVSGPDPLDIVLTLKSVSYNGDEVSACFSIHNQTDMEVQNIRLSFFHSPNDHWTGDGQLALAEPVEIGTMDANEVVEVCLTITVDDGDVASLSSALAALQLDEPIDGDGYVWAHLTAGTQLLNQSLASAHVAGGEI